jgi:hypothetical protein
MRFIKFILYQQILHRFPDTLYREIELESIDVIDNELFDCLQEVLAGIDQE